MGGTNPCLGAKCTTADHTRGSACCRDLQIEILCGPRETKLESLVRSRLSPSLCKIERESPRSLGAEMISACGYLDARGECGLHGRLRADGNSAKPDLCFDWPKARSPAGLSHKNISSTRMYTCSKATSATTMFAALVNAPPLKPGHRLCAPRRSVGETDRCAA